MHPRAETPPQHVRLRIWAWLGLSLGLVAGLILWAPARWLATACAAATQGKVQLLNPVGTVWNGSAQLAIGSTASVALPGLVHWRFRPSGLGAQLTLSADCCNAPDRSQALHVRGGWSPSGLQLHWQSAGSRWPAQVLAGLGSPWNTLEPAGELHLRGDMQITRSEGRVSTQGQAQLDWMQAQSALSMVRPLGNYRLSMDGGASTQLRLTTLSGALQLDGEGQWVGDKLRFSGTAQASPQEQAALGSLLNLIGQRKGPVSRISIG